MAGNRELPLSSCTRSIDVALRRLLLPLDVALANNPRTHRRSNDTEQAPLPHSRYSSSQCPARRTKTSPAINATSRGRQQQTQQPRRRVTHIRPTTTTNTATTTTTNNKKPNSNNNSTITTGNCENNSLERTDSDEDVAESKDVSSNSTTNSIASLKIKDLKIHNNNTTKELVNKENDAMQPRLDWKLALLYTLLVLQVLIVMVYVTSTPHMRDINSPAQRDTVSFVDIEPLQANYENKSRELRTITSETSLRDVKTFKLFQAYNRTLCWRSGVDEKQMQRTLLSSNEYNNEIDDERCICNQGWHGSDCGQPEVVWRAIMASKQNIKLKRRKLARRIVHTFYVNDHNTAIAEVIVEELYPVVDLFVVCDFSTAEDNFRHKLAKGFLAKQQDKILYVNVASKAKKPTRIISKYVWEHVKKVVKNIRDDDIYVTTDSEQILNGRALMFLKIYDGWPQPIAFRLRWSVFGFFWQHPQKTTITVVACTIGLMREAHRFNSLILEKQLNSDYTYGTWVIGDLNHYGGWYCQYCQGPANIIATLRNNNNTLIFDRNIDVPFVEDLIGSGTWFDEKTNLLRAHRSRESYYAPETVINNTWKYDWLVENFYAKLDYY